MPDPNDNWSIINNRWPFGAPRSGSSNDALYNVSDGLRAIYGGIPPEGPTPAQASDFSAMNGIGQMGQNAKTDWWKAFRPSTNVEYDPSVADPTIGGNRMLKQWNRLDQLLKQFQSPAQPSPINMQKPTSLVVTPAGLPGFPTLGIRG